MLNTEKWEFGSIEWCDFASRLGMRLLKRAGLDLQKLTWGFSEEYLAIPKRLLKGRAQAGYYLLIRDGEITGFPETRYASLKTKPRAEASQRNKCFLFVQI